MPFEGIRIDLDAAKIAETARQLRNRIKERFPEAGLGRQADKLIKVAEATVQQIEILRRPNLLLRIGIGLLIAAIPVSLGAAIWAFRLSMNEFRGLADFVAFFQASVESLIFLGIGIAFLMTLEVRAKRNRALRAVHNLRVLAHLVDAHQLNKDPIRSLSPGHDTPSSPQRTMTPFELNRYLDYCSEMLSVIGKIGGLYGQQIQDPVALGSIDQVEALSSGLSRKIWQKMMLLEKAATAE